MVDEAVILDTRVTGELLAATPQAGAKLVLNGDDRQLASIECSGIFAELRPQHGAAKITEVTRQTVDWQRQAARDLAEGRLAEGAAAGIPASLDGEVGARDAAVQRDTEEVNQQRVRDAVEVPSLSKAALATLDDVRDSIQATRTQGDGERYAAQQQRQEAAVAGAWAAGRFDRNVAGELDRFMAAAAQRLGGAGKQVASRAAGRPGGMKLPGVGQEQQAGLDVLARTYKLGRKGANHSGPHGHRVGREE